MRAAIHLLERLDCDVGVDLGCADIGVTQHLLDVVDVRAAYSGRIPPAIIL